MPVADVNLGQHLDAWLDHLNDKGFHVGVRERLVIQTLLAQLSADGTLAEFQSLQDILSIAEPLICIKPEQQRQYSVLFQEFVHPQQSGHLNDSIKRGPWLKEFAPVAWVSFYIIACVVVLFFGVLLVIDRQKTPTIGMKPTPNVEQPLSSKETEQDRTIQIIVLGVGILALFAIGWRIWARWSRQLYLQAIRTDEEITERFLYDPCPMVLQPAAAIVRGASRQLRQRYAGERHTIDIPSTIYATMAAGGAFTPRYHALPQTPEYLVLIDQRHPSDHHTMYSQSFIDALKDAGVSVQVFYFEGSPQTRCWQIRRSSKGLDRIKIASMSELAARFAGHRLLMFADAQALVEESDGELRDWAQHLRIFPQRAWFTPMPLASWGPLEQMVDEQGFLLLPIQQESLITMASWFSSGQLGLEMAEDWPLNYPPMLRGQDVAWVIRQTALPIKDHEELVFQLRNYLGATRFQWLCACALFPAVSPAITLSLGRELVGENMRELALGVAAISALPWFRHALMPTWLRQALVGCLNRDNETRFREVIEKRLADAIEDRVGPSLLSVAKKKHLLTAWFRRRSGLARDVVLVGFLYSGPLANLAQRLPEALRKRLFRGGLPAWGIASGVLLPWLLRTGFWLGLLILIVFWFASGGFLETMAPYYYSSSQASDLYLSKLRELGIFGR